MSGGTGSQRGLSWYWNRLRSMSATEILHRANEEFAKRRGRALCAPWESFGDALVLPGEIARAFEPARLESCLLEAVALRAEASAVGRLSFLGRDWPEPDAWPPGPAFWHEAPGEETRSAGRYCFDVPRSDRFLKGVLEVNRLQILVPLAIDARVRDDASRAALVLDLIRSWMEANPPYRGLNWLSGIELAARAVSVAFAATILGEARLGAEDRRRLGAFFDAHERWIARFPSLHSSANNHLVAELVGLVVCRRMRGASQDAIRADRDYASLLRVLGEQFHADGVGGEQSPAYTAFTLELALIAFFLAGERPSALPAALRTTLERAGEHLAWLMDRSGGVPNIGDNDAGRGLALGTEPEPLFVASVLAALAAFLERPDLAPPRHAPHLRDRLFGRDAADGPPPRTGLRTFPEGGYTVLARDGERGFRLVADHGPLGFLSIAAHGHADALAIWLSVGGEPVLVDAGMPTYRPDDPARDRFRGTPEHNTLSIDGGSSSVMAGAFNWSRKAQARLGEQQEEPPRLRMAHDGYRAAHGVEHEREIGLSGDTIALRDRLVGAAGEHRVSIGFLLAPECRAEAEGAAVAVMRDGRPVLRLAGDGRLAVSVRPAELSRAYGSREPSSRIVFEGRLATGTEHLVRLELL